MASNNKPVKNMKKLAEDVYNIVIKWPFHMLDQVKASGVDSALESMIYAVGELLSPGSSVASYTVGSTINELRGLRSWIMTNKMEGVTLSNMDKALTELDQLLQMLEDARIQLAMEDKRDIHEGPMQEGSIFGGSEE